MKERSKHCPLKVQLVDCKVKVTIDVTNQVTLALVRLYNAVEFLKGNIETWKCTLTYDPSSQPST